jgi:hypothetical protein
VSGISNKEGTRLSDNATLIDVAPAEMRIAAEF